MYAYTYTHTLHIYVYMYTYTYTYTYNIHMYVSPNFGENLQLLHGRKSELKLEYWTWRRGAEACAEDHRKKFHTYLGHRLIIPERVQEAHDPQTMVHCETKNTHTYNDNRKHFTTLIITIQDDTLLYSLMTHYYTY